MSDTIGDLLAVATMVVALGLVIIMACTISDLIEFTEQHQEEYALGSTVTTTTEYEVLTNDSFTGVVVGGDYVWDSSLTIRNRDGIERMIAFEFLEPV